MSKIAKDAFAKSNYHLAVEIFERCLRDKYNKNLPITLDLYFWYGDSLARTGRLYEAFDIYTYICNKLNNEQIPLERLKHLSSSLLDSLINNNKQYQQQQQQRSQLHNNNETLINNFNNTSYDNSCSSNNLNQNEQCHLLKQRLSTTASTITTTIINPSTITNNTNNNNNINNNITKMPCNNNFDSLLCPICNDILNCPVTATCGHTFCRDCFQQNQLNNNKCHICLIKTNNIYNNYNKNSNNCFNNNNNNNNRNNNFGTNLKPDILVRRLVDKWWGPQLQARDLNQQAIKYLHLNKFDDALKFCNESLEKCPKNINSLLIRSEVLCKLNHYQSSLADADNALRCHPTSAKAFYRRALALMGLNKNDEAFIAQCLAASLDRNISSTSSFKADISRLLQRIISSANKTKSCGEAHTSAAPYNLPSSRRRQQQRRKLKTITQHQQQFGTSDCDEANSSCGEDDHHTNNNVHFKNRRYSRRHSTIHVDFPIITQSTTTLKILLDRIQQELHKLKKNENYSHSHLNVNPSLIDVADFDCVLCCRTLWKPVVTPCGHTYCWVCLDRCMDYSSSCPLCMTPLVEQYLSNYHQQLCSGGNTPIPFSLGEKSVTRFLEVAMQNLIPEWYEKRRRQEIDIEPSVPVFICTTAFPNVPCPLFVYEPRYRLMVRRAIESGERQFGIVQPFTGKSRYSDIGTMLDIRDSVLLGDGCSILSTIGCKRFKILTRNEKDGYETAQVEFINDEPISENTISQVYSMHSSVLRKARKWFESLSMEIKEEIIRSFGSMPSLEENWEKVGDGPAWAWWIIAILPLNQQLKINILATTSLEKRLRAIGKTLDFINGKVRRSQQNCIAVPCDGLPACQAVECCQRTSTVTTTADEHHVTTNQHTSFFL